MGKVIRLTESDLQRIIKRVVSENKIEKIKQSDDFLELVDILQSHPRAAEKLRDEMSESLNEDDDYHYYDYIDHSPQKISKGEYWKRRLKTLGLGSAIGAVMGVMMAGGLSADDVLQMALASAAGVGFVSDKLVRTVGRTKEEEPNAKDIEENYKRRRKTIKEQQTKSCVTPVTPKEIVDTVNSLTKNLGYSCLFGDRKGEGGRNSITLNKDLCGGSMFIGITYKPGIGNTNVKMHYTYQGGSQPATGGNKSVPIDFGTWNESTLKKIEQKLCDKRNSY